MCFYHCVVLLCIVVGVYGWLATVGMFSGAVGPREGLRHWQLCHVRGLRGCRRSSRRLVRGERLCLHPWDVVWSGSGGAFIWSFSITVLHLSLSPPQQSHSRRSAQLPLTAVPQHSAATVGNVAISARLPCLLLGEWHHAVRWVELWKCGGLLGHSWEKTDPSPSTCRSITGM